MIISSIDTAFGLCYNLPETKSAFTKGIQTMTHNLEVRKDGFYIDGEKFFLISGDFHYFRTVPEGWERRLKLMKDFGLTAVTTYVAWNLHEPKRGEFCFEGICDLPLFLTLAQKVGLKVVLRCSPYMCGEWEF